MTVSAAIADRPAVANGGLRVLAASTSQRSRPSRSRRRGLCVPVEEFDLDAQHLIEAPATLVDVVVAAATAIQLATGGLLGDADGRADWRHRVLLRDDEQDGAANGGGTSHRPTPGEAEQRPSGDAITPFGAVFRSHEP